MKSSAYYIAATGVVYGITLGLIAVAVWEDHIRVSTKVEEESATLSALYRDVNSYPEPDRGKLTGKLKKYTRYVVDEAWPLQAKGIVPVVLRRLRIQNVKVDSHMIWWVIFFGGLANLMLSWLFVVKNKALHVLMNALLGALIGALIFLILALDSPFRGWFKVSSQPFETTYRQLMK
jgi:hypothetical protein